MHKKEHQHARYRAKEYARNVNKSTRQIGSVTGITRTQLGRTTHRADKTHILSKYICRQPNDCVELQGEDFAGLIPF